MERTNAIKKAIWLKSLLAQRDSFLVEGIHVVMIHCDNERVIALAKNPKSYAQSKHINI